MVFTLEVYPVIKDGEERWIVDDDKGRELGFGISISHAMRMAAVNMEVCTHGDNGSKT